MPGRLQGDRVLACNGRHAVGGIRAADKRDMRRKTWQADTGPLPVHSVDLLVQAVEESVPLAPAASYVGIVLACVRAGPEEKAE